MEVGSAVWLSHKSQDSRRGEQDPAPSQASRSAPVETQTAGTGSEIPGVLKLPGRRIPTLAKFESRGFRALKDFFAAECKP